MRRLAGGWLTGKYRRNEPPPAGSRATESIGTDGGLGCRPARGAAKICTGGRVKHLAHEAGLSLTHLAMAFAAEHPAVSSVIMGPKTLAQLQDTLGAAEVRAHSRGAGSH